MDSSMTCRRWVWPAVRSVRTTGTTACTRWIRRTSHKSPRRSPSVADPRRPARHRANRPTCRWFGAVSYTYSSLRGNYAGLTNSDPTDGGGGRHSPNNGRAFDLPTMTYLPSGKPDDGPLSTDRPNTGKLFGSYRLNWFGQLTTIALSQGLYQGTPISTCLGVLGIGNPDSACQWAEGCG